MRGLAREDPLESPSWPAPPISPDEAATEPPEGTSTDDDHEENALDDNLNDDSATSHPTPQINYGNYVNKPIFFNENLTKSRALLAKEARNLKKLRKIIDTRVYDGKILIKDKNGQVKMINNMAELDTYK